MSSIRFFRQFRPLEAGEFILCFGDCSQGGEDSNFAQFISQTSLDFPLVYERKNVAMQMTQDIFPILETIADITGVPPVVAFERQNGGASEMQRLSDLNVKNKYRLFVMPEFGVTDAAETNKLGWDTNLATRPKMLGEWQMAFNKRIFKIYDEETIRQHKAFIVKNNKPQASAHRHDDAVMACAGAYQLFQLCRPEVINQLGSWGGVKTPGWVNSLPDWTDKWK